MYIVVRSSSPSRTPPRAADSINNFQFVHISEYLAITDNCKLPNVKETIVNHHHHHHEFISDNEVHN